MLLDQIEKKVRAWVKRWILRHRFLWLIIGVAVGVVLCGLSLLFFNANYRFMSLVASVLLVFILLWRLSSHDTRAQMLIMVAKQWILAHRLIGAAFGIVFFCFLVIFFLGTDSRFTNSIALLALALPVFTLLWLFRTHDTREQINQAAYFKGSDNLASNELLKTVIGVRQLVELRKLTTEYDRSMVIAFEKFFQLRQKSDQGEASDQAKESGQSIDYTQIDFSDIYLHGARLKKANLQALKLNGADLSSATLNGAELNNTRLESANLSGAFLNPMDFKASDSPVANLSHAHLRGADLTSAKLIRAYLSHADLRGADLTDADLSHANLNEAKLNAIPIEEKNGEINIYPEVNLSNTNFNGAKNLKSANFEGAFYYANMKPIGIDFESPELDYRLKDDTKDGKPIVRLHYNPKKTD